MISSLIHLGLNGLAAVTLRGDKMDVCQFIPRIQERMWISYLLEEDRGAARSDTIKSENNWSDGVCAF